MGICISLAPEKVGLLNMEFVARLERLRRSNELRCVSVAAVTGSGDCSCGESEERVLLDSGRLTPFEMWFGMLRGVQCGSDLKGAVMEAIAYGLAGTI